MIRACAGIDGLFARAMRNEHLWIAAVGVIAFLIVLQAFALYRLPLATGSQDPADFVAFHTAGHLVWSGQAIEAYDRELFEPHLRSFGGMAGQFAWAYPPQTMVLCAPLGLLPIWLAYLIYALAGFGLFCLVVKRIAGCWAPGALAVALPAAIINARAGQVGFWIAALIGLYILEFRKGRARAGLPLGLMILKPHLAAGVGFLALIERRWKVVAIAAVVGVVTSGLATLALGAGVWPAFVKSLGDTGELLAQARFPLSRMTSVYVFAYRTGMSIEAALAVHAGAALAIFAGLLWLRARRAASAFLIAAAVTAGLFVSPYVYDYDLPVLALVAGLLLPGLAERSRSWELGGIFALAWLAMSNSQIVLAEIMALTHIYHPPGRAVLISFSAPLLAVTAGWIVLVLRRPQSP